MDKALGASARYYGASGHQSSRSSRPACYLIIESTNVTFRRFVSCRGKPADGQISPGMSWRYRLVRPVGPLPIIEQVADGS